MSVKAHKAFRCEKGHSWEVTLGGDAPAALAFIVCPQCGSAAESLPGAITTNPDQAAAAKKASPDPAAGSWQNYEILGELGRGGMGVVYKARQRGLGRLVALKMILVGLHASREHLVRFRKEAEAVARLQHPHIVQIYEIGEHRSQPYVSLEYVDGGSLDQVLAGQPQPPRDAAQVLETLARTVHFAHEHGVVHRDLKPGNILLSSAESKVLSTESKQDPSPFSTQNSALSTCMPKIADFGLAKLLGEQAREQMQTRSGAVLGTPAYMAPEQAAGVTRAVGPACDIYALGTILYEMLVGRPPFQGTTVLETLALVSQQEPVPPRSLRPGVPRDLETICLKCLRKEPGRRYASAAELADDLQRFGAGEPIRARPVGWLERGWRWCRRKPALAGLSAALVLVVAGSLVSLTLLWLTANEDRLRAQTNFRLAETNRQAAVQSQQLAEQNLKDARQAAYRHFVSVSEVELGNDPSLQPLRRQLLQEARDFFQRFVEQRPAQAPLQADLADAHFRLGLLTRQIGSQTQALAELDRARELYGRLVRTDPTEKVARDRLAACYTYTGQLQTAQRQVQQALSSFQQAETLSLRSLALDANNAEARRNLISTYVSLGNLQAKVKQPQAALNTYRQALELQEAWAKAEPQTARRRAELAAICANIGVVHVHQTRNIPEALHNYERALALREELFAAEPANHEYQAALASSYNNLGVLHLDRTRKYDRAKEYFNKALEQRADLGRHYPKIIEYQRRWAETLSNLGIAQSLRGLKEEALQSFKQVLAIRAKLAAEQPTDSFRKEVADSHFNLGKLLTDLGRTEEALREHRAALAIRQQLRLAPDIRASEVEIAKVLNHGLP
jgi:serine/threonine protein kinase/tetratricopeptide (TPR) repeat protein